MMCVFQKLLSQQNSLSADLPMFHYIDFSILLIFYFDTPKDHNKLEIKTVAICPRSNHRLPGLYSHIVPR